MNDIEMVILQPALVYLAEVHYRLPAGQTLCGLKARAAQVVKAVPVCHQECQRCREQAYKAAARVLDHDCSAFDARVAERAGLVVWDLDIDGAYAASAWKFVELMEIIDG